MILDETTQGYTYQLTKAFINKKRLDFATKLFKDDLDRHCVIKQTKDRTRADGFAVFTEGKFIMHYQVY
ncbi:unnamed protein product [marine sediment metagenome]|uniref:Uncharacterized protein n=1 Tax=marine sediment metagenome TaxID=412755 RepID=X1DMN4_9ZZZZ